MPGPQTTPNGQQVNVGEGSSNDGSKFKRFLKRFGRHPSDDSHAQANDSAQTGQLASSNQDPANESNGVTDGGHEAGRRFGSTRNRKESKGKAGNGPKGKRSDALLAGRFFQSSSNAPPLPKTTSTLQSSTASSPGAEKTMKAAFSEGTNVGGLANTLTLPPEQTSPPPRLQGLPRHVPIATGELLQASSTPTTAPERPPENNVSTLTAEEAKESSESKQTANQIVTQTLQSKPENEHMASAAANGAAEHTDVNALSPQSSYSSRRSRGPPSFESGSAALDRVRDSVDNRTMDTNKSRASTKPTTLMSMDTRENVQNTTYAPMAQIAQHRSGEPGPGSTSSQIRSTSGRIPSDISASPSTQQHSAIHFASAPPLGRTASGTIVQLPGQDEAPEETPYTNVPSLSRPHPANNPHPAGVPADNASMLTLASSTAAASIGGGAASSRGHSHAAPSFGGARSIGGSLMGERRNSSDTYASVKALPPLSRRGSDASARTGMSIAASATGLNSAQAVSAHAAYTASGAGPGAPADRVSIHRTPSQRTVATQLSIPLSSSTHALTGAQGDVAAPATLDSTSALLAAPPSVAPATWATSVHDPIKDAQTAIPADPIDAAETPTAMAVPSIRTTPVSQG